MIYAISVPIEVIGALVIAYLLHERIPGWRVFRSAFFLPAVYSTVVIGIIAGVILQTNGPIDDSLRAAGLPALAKNWLGSPADARTAIIAIVIWANFGYSVLIYLAGMSALDPQLGEAARMDNASPHQIFRMVLVPLARPALGTLAIFNILYAWNEFIFALLLLDSNNVKTLTVGVLQLQGRYTINYPVIMAGLLVASIPVVVAYLFFQKFLVRGMVAGAVR